MQFIFDTFSERRVAMNGINSFKRGYSFKITKTNIGEKAVSRMVSKYESRSLRLLKCTSSLKNMNNYSLDGIDSELFLPRANDKN
jgi:hypothetical protein